MQAGRFTRRSFLALSTGALAVTKAFGKAEHPEKQQARKKVLLIGDFIKAGYQSRLEELMRGRAELISPVENCGTSVEVLRHLEKWLKQYDPDVVMVNCGFEDIRTLYYGTYETMVPLRHYERNVKNLLDMAYLFSSKVVPVWITTTMVQEDRHSAAKARIRDYSIFNDDVIEYNKTAVKLCRRQKVPVVDLYNAMALNSPDALLESDGYRLSAMGVEIMARAVYTQMENYL